MNKRSKTTAFQGEDESYRILVETMNEGAVTLLPEGTVTYCNPRFSEMVGMSPDKVIGCSFVRFLSPEQQPLFTLHLERSRNGGGKAKLTLVAGNGSTVPAQLSVRPLVSVGGFCLVITDLTESKRSVEEHGDLAAIVESSHYAIIGKSPEGIIQSWNKGAESLYGYTPSEAIGQSIVFLAPPDRRAEIGGLLNVIKQGKQIESYETVRVTKAGGRVDVSISIYPLKNSSGKVFGASTIARDITERKRAQTEFRLTEFSFEHASEGMFWMDSQGHIIRANEAACRSLGRSHEEILSLSIPDIDPLFPKQTWATFWEEIKRRGSLTFETEHQTKQGRIFPVEVTATYLRFDEKEYSFAFARDITERAQAEAWLRESEERFRATFENAGIGMALVDMQGHPFKSNPTLQKMLGYSEEELKRMAFTEYTHPDDCELDWWLYGELTAGKREKYEIEKRFLKKGGGLVWGLLTVSLVKDAHGHPVCAVGMVQDISERKQTEAALIKEKYLLHTLMDNLPDLIYFKDRESRFTLINLALAKKFELDHPDQAIGKTDFDFLAAEHAEEFHKDDAELLRTGQAHVGKEEKGIWPDGEVTWLSTTKMPLRDPSGNIIGTFGVSRDITERKLVEDALCESEENFRSLVSNIPEVAWTMDSKLRFVFISGNIERVSGFSPDEVYQKGSQLYLSSLHPDDVHKVKECFRALFAEGHRARLQGIGSRGDRSGP